MQNTRPRALLILRRPLLLKDVLYERHRFPRRIGRPISLFRHILRWLLERQLRNVARTVREDVVCRYAYQTLRAGQTSNRRRRLINLGATIYAKPSRVVEELPVEANE